MVVLGGGWRFLMSEVPLYSREVPLLVGESLATGGYLVNLAQRRAFNYRGEGGYMSPHTALSSVRSRHSSSSTVERKGQR